MQSASSTFSILLIKDFFRLFDGTLYTLLGPTLKPHLHALKKSARHAKFLYRADDFKAQHSQFSTCKRIGPECSLAPVLKILGVPRLPPGGSLVTGNYKRGTVPKIWRAVPIFLAPLNGVFKRNRTNKKETTQIKQKTHNKNETTQIKEKTYQ